MNTYNKILLCCFFLSVQTSVFAANKVYDRELHQAYNLLVKQPAKKTIGHKKVTINSKSATSRTPQINATLVAKKQINKNYRWGGTSPGTGFDCSGLMQYAYKASKVYLPRTASAQYNHTKRVSMQHLKVGDLIFFHTRRTRARVNHVGIYLGGGKFIHAPRRGKRVSITDLNKYWRKKAVGAGRV